MTKMNLSPEIVSLIHHVELNESGWWRKAVGQVIRSVLWKNQATLTVAELQTSLLTELGVRLSEDVVARQLESLVGQGSATRLPGPNYKLTEKTRQELTTAHEVANAEQHLCRERFLSSCAANCSGLDPERVWQEFSRALLSAIHVTGANLFHLLADGNLEREDDWLALFLSKFDPERQGGLKAVLRDFFEPGNHACRNQVLRLLSAHFFAEASQLRPETLALIEGERKTRTIKVVLDTNFIFSVLELHDNPGDGAALSLLDVASQAGRSLEVKFYVLPSTLDEAQRALLNQLHLVERVRTTPALARAAMTQPLPSIAKKFFEAAMRTPGLSASSFFQPYIDDLRTILRAKGIAVLEAHQTVYHTRQDVVDDVIDEQRREEAELPEHRRKGYETLLHDAVLWHAVSDRRPTDSDSPFDVEYWAVSIDWRLIAFDRRKRAANRSRLPVVLHPSNLVQLVQFWVPRSKELAESLVDSIRLPLYFQAFDPEDERATVKVLEAISRFENVGDLPEKTLKVVLANQALRGRLREADASNEAVFELVREQILAEHRNTVDELASVRGAANEALARLEIEQQGRQLVTDELSAKARELEAARTAAADAEHRATEAVRLVSETEKRLRSERDAIDLALASKSEDAAKLERRLQRQTYCLTFIAFPLLIGSIAAFPGVDAAVEAWPTLGTKLVRLGLACGIGLTPLAVALIASPYYTRARVHLPNWWPVVLAEKVGAKGVLAPLGMAGSAIFQGGLWDWVKVISGFNPG